MTGVDPSSGEPPTEDDAAELVAQLRELAGADPADARQVVSEVLAALDRAAGGGLRAHLPEAIRRDVDAGIVTGGHH
ncbi:MULTISPECIES: DUF2267 domain-containing protein [Micromonospora]|uniref:Uncharacterized protein n=1 Tax=Micromonospora yangpuensis TaxID=683228 RepID=A0A1C6TZL1_9ACTN|nr:DUF2267 domain-containing protein [Micromonospora yangpuensis]GGM21300.1 hypothetical protein GCM10012279_44580 [Micromonospora yangpuensis]SCL47204.1 hypothetical protein GA0070617_0506 [Micromonospora yangpuensis]